METLNLSILFYAFNIYYNNLNTLDYILKKLFLIYSKKILEKIICKGIIASEYLGRIKKTDMIVTLAIKNNIKKFIWLEFLLDKIIPIIDVIPMNKTGK